MGAATLHQRLAALDPTAAARIDPTNLRRIIRALEVCLVTGRPFSEQQGARPTPYRTLLLGLNMDRAALYARADTRIGRDAGGGCRRGDGGIGGARLRLAAALDVEPGLSRDRRVSAWRVVVG